MNDSKRCKWNETGDEFRRNWKTIERRRKIAFVSVFGSIVGLFLLLFDDYESQFQTTFLGRDVSGEKLQTRIHSPWFFQRNSFLSQIPYRPYLSYLFWTMLFCHLPLSSFSMTAFRLASFLNFVSCNFCILTKFAFGIFLFSRYLSATGTTSLGVACLRMPIFSMFGHSRRPPFSPDWSTDHPVE